SACVSTFFVFVFFFQAEDGIRDRNVTGVQTCALPISGGCTRLSKRWWTKATTSRAYSENYINIVESIEQTAEAVFFLWRKFCPAARTPPGRRAVIFKQEPGSPPTKIKDRHNVPDVRYSKRRR